MKRLSEYVKWYLYITTGILIVCTICFVISGEDTIPVATLWEILLSGFLTTLSTVLVHRVECKKIGTAVIKYLLHYILVCLIMAVCGSRFGWIPPNPAGIFVMVGYVAVVYVFSFCVHYIIDLGQARKINRRLKEKYRDP